MTIRPLTWVEPDGDQTHGEMVIIAARWILVLAGLGLALWNPTGLVQLQIAIVVILALAVGNFALHMQVMTGGRLLSSIVYAASVADLFAISLLIIAGGGFPAAPYVFYFPALLAISVTFRTEITALYAATTIVTYLCIAVVSLLPITSAVDVLPLVLHLLMLAAVPLCGNVYWRLERDRRRRLASRATVEAVPAAMNR